MKPLSEFTGEIIVLLDQDGWCQGSSMNSAGQRCVMGAFDEVFRNAWSPSGPNWHGTWTDEFRKTIGPNGNIVGWNDESGRTYEEVRGQLVATMERLQEEGR